MSRGNLVFVGAILAAGALAYQSTMGDAAAPPPANVSSPTGTPEQTHNTEMPTAAPHDAQATPTPSHAAPAATPTVRLTLDQVRGLPRPVGTAVRSPSSQTYPAATPTASPYVPTPARPPTAEATPTAEPPPGSPEPSPESPPTEEPTATPEPDPRGSLPYPPPLPPPPDAGLASPPRE